MASTLTYLHEVGVSFQGGQVLEKCSCFELKAFAHATHRHPPLVHSAKQPESHDWIRGSSFFHEQSEISPVAKPVQWVSGAVVSITQEDRVRFPDPPILEKYDKVNCLSNLCKF